MACETLVTTGMAVIAGEISTKAMPICRRSSAKPSRKSATTAPKWALTGRRAPLFPPSTISPATLRRAWTVRTRKPGAGDQGMMFGFACNETPTLMPAPIYWAHQLSQQLTKARKDGLVDFFRPDGKTQVSFEYVDGKPIRINNVVVSTQHAASASQADIIEA